MWQYASGQKGWGDIFCKNWGKIEIKKRNVKQTKKSFTFGTPLVGRSKKNAVSLLADPGVENLNPNMLKQINSISKFSSLVSRDFWLGRLGAGPSGTNGLKKPFLPS